MSDEQHVTDSITLNTVGIIHSPYKEKFAIPRQPGLNRDAIQIIELLPPYNKPDAVRGLEQVSHIWIEFIFHKAKNIQQKLTVRPPRLGGNKRLGVFATRSTHRPNPIGLSVVELVSIQFEHGVQLTVRGGDFLDQTPVVDIKPYLPYVDAIHDAENKIAERAPHAVKVSIASSIQKKWCQIEPPTQRFIIEALSYDPKPSYTEVDPERRYGVKLDSYEIGFRYLSSDQIEIIDYE